MKLFKLFGIAISAAAMLTLCACTSGQSAQTTAASNSIGTPTEMQMISYEPHYDETYDAALFYVDVLGEPTIEEGKISQDNGKGATLVSTIETVEEGKTCADLLEAYIDRSRNIVEEIADELCYLVEIEEDGMTTCRFCLFAEEKMQAVAFELTFPSEERSTYFQHVSMLVSIYADIMLGTDAAAQE